MLDRTPFSMPLIIFLVACCLAVPVLFVSCAALLADSWPEFRGPTGQGHSTSTGLPLIWSESHNIVWKIPTPGRGWSSPVILGDQIWITTATEEGHSLRALGFDRASGRMLHNVEIFHLEQQRSIHGKNSYASPTPILENDRIYVHFGALGTAALKSSGEILWKTQELGYEHGHGPGASPALYGGLLVISCDGTDLQYVAALDKNIGRIRWRTPRREGAMAYSTPLVIQTGNVQQVISPGGHQAVSYDLKTGKELWWIRYNGFSQVARPIFGHGLVYIINPALGHPVLFAVRPDGHGDVTKSHIVWSRQRAVSLTPSPLIVGDEIYLVSDNGIATCLDAKTGQERWMVRLNGNFSASPIYADGRIYFLNEAGETTVIEPGRKFERLAENHLDGVTLSSMAVAGQAIFLRTDSSLYRIENRDGK